jgi:D-arabinose 1-dehydrogenase-like Zn-dependent alcohol dehydrogenase
MRIRPEVTVYQLQQANQALMDLKRGSLKGAKVLECSSE